MVFHHCIPLPIIFVTIVTTGRRKRDEFAEGLTYSDYFPEYPPGMRIRKDVASFVSCGNYGSVIVTTINCEFQLRFQLECN